MSKSILLVDDEPEILHDWKHQLEKLGYRVIASHASAETALSWLDSGKSAALGLIDIGLPGMDGVSLIRQIREQYPNIHLIVLTVFNDAPTVLEALRAGARGYLLKDANLDELAYTLQCVEQGGAAMTHRATEHLISHFNAEGITCQSSSANIPLPPRESEVLTLLSRGLSYPDIARVPGIGLGTVQTHIKSIYAKLDVCTKAEATAVALNQKIIEPWLK